MLAFSGVGMNFSTEVGGGGVEALICLLTSVLSLFSITQNVNDDHISQRALCIAISFMLISS